MLVPLFRVENIWTIVVGGGSGTRFGRPKQYELLDDRRMIDHSVAVAAASGDGVVVVVPVGDVERESVHFRGTARVVAGGSTRSASVRCGLAAVPDDADVVVVHDAARPCASAELFAAVVEAIRQGADGAVPGLPVTDTIKMIAGKMIAGKMIDGKMIDGKMIDGKMIDGDAVVTATLPRDLLVAVQTPQAFRADVLRAAHASGVEGTDDAAVVEEAGGRVVVVAGDPENRKVTHLDDLEWARHRFGAARVAGEAG